MVTQGKHVLGLLVSNSDVPGLGDVLVGLNPAQKPVDLPQIHGPQTQESRAEVH